MLGNAELRRANFEHTLRYCERNREWFTPQSRQVIDHMRGIYDAGFYSSSLDGMVDEVLNTCRLPESYRRQNRH